MSKQREEKSKFSANSPKGNALHDPIRRLLIGTPVTTFNKRNSLDISEVHDDEEKVVIKMENLMNSLAQLSILGNSPVVTTSKSTVNGFNSHIDSLKGDTGSKNNNNHNDAKQIDEMETLNNFLSCVGSGTKYLDRAKAIFHKMSNVVKSEVIDPDLRLKLLEILELKSCVEMTKNSDKNSAKHTKSNSINMQNGNENEYQNSILDSKHSMLYTHVANGYQNAELDKTAPDELTKTVSFSESNTVIEDTAIIDDKNDKDLDDNNKTQGGNKYAVKDIIYIKSNDAGRVMGVKGKRIHQIEELSNTVVSFQKDFQNNEREVTLSGPSSDAIKLAKILIKETIKRNSSPTKEFLSDDNLVSLTKNNYEIDEEILSHFRSTPIAGTNKCSHNSKRTTNNLFTNSRAHHQHIHESSCNHFTCPFTHHNALYHSKNCPYSDVIDGETHNLAVHEKLCNHHVNNKCHKPGANVIETSHPQKYPPISSKLSRSITHTNFGKGHVVNGSNGCHVCEEMQSFAGSHHRKSGRFPRKSFGDLESTNNTNYSNFSKFSGLYANNGNNSLKYAKKYALDDSYLDLSRVGRTDNDESRYDNHKCHLCHHHSNQGTVNKGKSIVDQVYSMYRHQMAQPHTNSKIKEDKTHISENCMQSFNGSNVSTATTPKRDYIYYQSMNADPFSTPSILNQNNSSSQKFSPIMATPNLLSFPPAMFPPPPMPPFPPMPPMLYPPHPPFLPSNNNFSCGTNPMSPTYPKNTAISNKIASANNNDGYMPNMARTTRQDYENGGVTHNSFKGQNMQNRGTPAKKLTRTKSFSSANTENTRKDNFDNNSGKSKYFLQIGDTTLTLQGKHEEIVELAQNVIEKYFETKLTKNVGKDTSSVFLSCEQSGKKWTLDSNNEKVILSPKNLKTQKYDESEIKRNALNRTQSFHHSMGANNKDSYYYKKGPNKYHEAEYLQLTMENSLEETHKEHNGHILSPMEKYQQGFSKDPYVKPIPKDVTRIAYTKDFMIKCAFSPFARASPKNLPQLLREASFMIKPIPQEPSFYLKPQLDKYNSGTIANKSKLLHGKNGQSSIHGVCAVPEPTPGLLLNGTVFSDWVNNQNRPNIIVTGQHAIQTPKSPHHPVIYPPPILPPTTPSPSCVMLNGNQVINIPPPFRAIPNSVNIDHTNGNNMNHGGKRTLK